MQKDLSTPKEKEHCHHPGLLHAYALDGLGKGLCLDWEQVRKWDTVEAPVWIHLDRKSPQAQAWLRRESGLGPVVCGALLAEETRPRAQTFSDGMLVILRGVNLNPGAQPDDMISVRIWVDARRIITLRSPKLLALSDVRKELEEGNGPQTTAGLLVSVVEKISQRMAPVVANLEELADAIEESMLQSADSSLRSNLAEIRRQAIALRRHIGPQREAVAHLMNSQLPWMEQVHRSRLHEAGDQATRYIEELDPIRERASIVHEELSARLSEQMNRTMFLLSIVAGIFLPLGLITGLLGINVGGMPGVDSPFAFWIVCLLLVTLGAGSVFLFRKLKLF